MSTLEPVDRFLDQNGARFVDELKELLRIPSVSADPARRPDMRRAAEFVCDAAHTGRPHSRELFPPRGIRSSMASGWAPRAPTALVYGHYDVQPPDPLDLWLSPPFEPTVRDGFLYARGACDDKGQVFTHIKSVEAWLKTAGRLPVNVKFVIEGEEEVGSNNLDRFLERAIAIS